MKRISSVSESECVFVCVPPITLNDMCILTLTLPSLLISGYIF